MTSSPGARFGTVEKLGDRYVLRYERELSHPIESVWRALTDADQIAAWLAAAEQLELREGGGIALRWQNVPDDRGEWDAKGVELDEADPSAPARGTITKLDPPHLIEYETDRMGLMRWELRATGDGCVLTFTNVVELSDRFVDQTLAGWHIHLDHLDDALAGHPVDWSTWTEDHMDRWSEIRDGYATARGR